MKRALLLTAASLLCLASLAHAGGVNFSWDHCWRDGGVLNRNFACGVNTGSDLMFGSFVLTQTMPALKGLQATVDIQSTSTSLPNWWQFYNAGSCRQTALGASFDFRGYPGSACADPFAGQAGGGITAYLTVGTTPPVPGGQANAARLILAATLPATRTATAGVEYNGFIASLSHAKTTGIGSCSGCAVPVSVVLTEIRVDDDDSAGNAWSEYLDSPLQNVCLTWQGATGVCGPTPVDNRTWGTIKALYR